MADIKFSEFPKATISKDSDEIAILQDGVNKMIASPVLESKIINKTVSRVIEQGGASLNVINLKGVVPTYADLATITPTPELNDAYQVEADGLVYVYTDTGFQADSEGFIVQPEPTGVVEEGNTQAVSGGEVFEKLDPISQSVETLNTLVTGEQDITPTVWTNEHVTLAGTLNSSSTYRLSPFIPVELADSYLAGLSGSANTLMVSAYTDANQSSFISGSSLNIAGYGDSSELKDIEFSISDENVKFIRVACYSTNVNDAYLKIISENSLVKDTQSIYEDINGKIITPTVWTNEYVTLTGTLSSSSSYRLSPFIPVELADSYLAGLSGSASTLMVSAYSADNQSSFISDSELNIVGYGASNELRDIRFSISEENVKFIRVSCSTNTINDVYLKKTGLENRVKALETQTNGFDVKDFSIIKKEIFSRRKPIFSFIFDDLNDTDELTYNIFKEFDFNVGFAIQSSKFNAENILMYQNMYVNGTTILSHGVTSVNDEPSMRNSKIALKENDFVVSGWVTNSSTLDPALLPTVKKYYGYAFTSAPPAKGVFPPVTDFNETVDPCELKRVGLEGWNQDEVNQQEIKDLIDYAIDNNLLITFYGHEMPSTYLNTDSTSRFKESDLRGVLSYLQEKQENGLCEVLSPDDAIQQYYKGIIF